MRVGDVVRIITQPKNQITPVQGLVALIFGIDPEPNKLVHINTIRRDGTSGGSGSVPIDCLELELGTEWIEAKRIWNERAARSSSDSQLFQSNWEKMIQNLALEHGIKPAEVKHIYNELFGLKSALIKQ